MEIEQATDLITQVGFPIFMCLLLFWDRVKTLENLTNIIKLNTESTNALKAYMEGLIK